MPPAFARFVVRKDAGLILGKSFGDLLKPDTVYQIEEILGELIIREIGPSEIATRAAEKRYPNWNHDANTIVEDGSHLYTPTEYKMRCALDNKNRK
jgi:hypothetical protein